MYTVAWVIKRDAHNAFFVEALALPETGLMRGRCFMGSAHNESVYEVADSVARWIEEFLEVKDVQIVNEPNYPSVALLIKNYLVEKGMNVRIIYTKHLLEANGIELTDSELEDIVAITTRAEKQSETQVKMIRLTLWLQEHGNK